VASPKSIFVVSTIPYSYGTPEPTSSSVPLFSRLRITDFGEVGGSEALFIMLAIRQCSYIICYNPWIWSCLRARLMRLYNMVDSCYDKTIDTSGYRTFTRDIQRGRICLMNKKEVPECDRGAFEIQVAHKNRKLPSP
jgi:hypothetical protein